MPVSMIPATWESPIRYKCKDLDGAATNRVNLKSVSPPPRLQPAGIELLQASQWFAIACLRLINPARWTGWK